MSLATPSPLEITILAGLFVLLLGGAVYGIHRLLLRRSVKKIGKKKPPSTRIIL